MMDNSHIADHTSGLLDQTRRIVLRALQTNIDKSRGWVQAFVPTHSERGAGSHVRNTDDNGSIDHMSSLMLSVFGHDYPPITVAVEREIHNETLFSLLHPLYVSVMGTLDKYNEVPNELVTIVVERLDGDSSEEPLRKQREEEGYR